MSRVFVSYRREDTQGEAGHLLADLRRRFGEARVFMDIAAIGPGEDFGVAIERAMAECSVVLVVIGRKWLEARNAEGARSLDDPADWVRLEVESALRGTRKVIPVLVQGASMPREPALPPSIVQLARRNAHEMSARRWDYDFDALARTLEDPLGAAPPADSSGRAGGRAARARLPLVLAGVLAAVLLASGVWLAWRPVQSPSVASAPASAPRVTTGFFGAESQPNSPFRDSLQFRLFAGNAAEYAQRAELTEAEINHLTAIGWQACTTGSDDCQTAVKQTLNQTFESVCANQRRTAGRAATASDFELIKRDLTFMSCVQIYTSISLAEIEQLMKGAIRANKPG